MATRCPNGHEIAEGGSFCPVCGVRLTRVDDPEYAEREAPAAPIARPIPEQHRPRSRLLAPIWHSRGWKGKTAVIVVAVLVGLGVLGAALGDGSTVDGSTAEEDIPIVPGSVTEPSSSNAPKAPRGYRDLFVAGMTTKKAAKPLCSTYQTTIDRWYSLAQARLASSRGADVDSYTAADFEQRVSWVHKDHVEPFKAAVYRASRARLQAVTQPGLTSGMIERFSRDALSSCKLRGDYDRAFSAVLKLNIRVNEVARLVASLPWYPRGFYEWNDNIAWRWVDNPNCDYFSCWQMSVTTRNGCPDGLYAEINIKRGGTVVDYSNDSLGSLGPGETALLEFTDTSESGGTGFLTEITCY